jgi:predicted PurR-regulated permease PerM
MLGLHQKSVRKAWSFAVVGLCLGGFFIIRKTILTFILALMFAYLVYPLVRFFQRRVTRGAGLPAVLILFLGIPVLVTCTGILLRKPITDEIRLLQQQTRSAEFRSNLAQWTVLGIPIGEKILDGRNVSFVQGQVVHWLPEIRGILGRIGRDFTSAIIVPILAFFMLKDGKEIFESIAGLCERGKPTATGGRRRSRLAAVIDDAHVLIQEYMQALVVLCLSVLVVFALAFSLLHVRYALLLSLVAAPLEFIPLVGPFVAGMGIVGACEFNHYPHTGAVITFLILYRVFQDYVLSPFLMKRSVRLHPLLVLFGVFAGGELGGMGGIFLSVPILAVGRLLFYEYWKQRPSLTSEEPQVRTAILAADGTI